MVKTIKLVLTVREARCLYQLAGEADFATFESDRKQQARNVAAGSSAISKLEAALDKADTQ